MSQRIYLSKSRFQSGRQCHKRLWLEVHQRDRIKYDDCAKARLEEGNRFGDLARSLLGGGIVVGAGPREDERAQNETLDLMSRPASDVPSIFEAAFEYEGVRVRADALLRTTFGDVLVEVKSSGSVKDEYLWDCTLQSWVIRGAGIALAKAQVGHVDNSFVLKTEGDYEGLLKIVDVTEDVAKRIADVPDIIHELKKVALGVEPTIATGSHCKNPNPCPFIKYCQEKEPPQPEFPVTLLPRGGKLAEELKHDGYHDLRDVPADRLSTKTHQRIALATRIGEPIVSPELAKSLDSIAFPRYYLDFETIGSVIPRWVGTRPFQQVPFQFSCHIERSDGHIEHREFLDISARAPMKDFVDALLEVCGTTGPILVWNRSFEAGRIKEMAEMFPAEANAMEAIVERMIDLLPIYRAYYYHPEMKGSWSIKKVLPTIDQEQGYDNLEIQNGEATQLAWLRAIDPATYMEERNRLRNAMLDYCKLDTWAMVKLVHWRPDATSE